MRLLRTIVDKGGNVTVNGYETDEEPRMPKYRLAETELRGLSAYLQWREKRGGGVGPTKRGKGSKIMAIADAMVFLSPCTWPALRLMKQNSSNLPSTSDSLPNPRNE